MSRPTYEVQYPNGTTVTFSTRGQARLAASKTPGAEVVTVQPAST